MKKNIRNFFIRIKHKFETKQNQKKELHDIETPIWNPPKVSQCRICKCSSNKIFEADVFNNYKADFFLCDKCNFVQLEDLSWIREAYKNAINDEDTGILTRNEWIRSSLSTIIYVLFDGKGKFLDFAGGYGILTRIMRDVGFDFYWYDKYCPNLLAKGFEGSIEQPYDAITAFEVFEHFDDPIAEIEKMLKLSKTIIFSTELLPKNIPAPKDWWYYGLSHGQHISFYSKETLKYIAQKYSLNYYNLQGLQILTKENVDEKKVLNLDFTKVKENLKSKTTSDFYFISSKKVNM